MAAIGKASVCGLLVLLIAAALSAVVQARDQSAYRRANLSLTERHVLPRYQMLTEAAMALDREARAFCQSPAAEGLAGLRTGFVKALDAWMGVQHLRFGPAQFLLRYDRFAYWPDQRNTGSRHLRRLLSARDPAALEPRAFARGSVAVQGFTALERLLYGKGADAAFLEASDTAGFRCQVLRAITGNLAEMAGGILKDWRDSDTAYRRVLETPGEDNAYYLDDKEVTLEFFKSFHGMLQMIADLKLARPLGSSVEKSKPRRSEAWRSGRSRENIMANLRALKEIYDGEGFAALVAAQTGDPELVGELSYRLDSALAAAEGIRQPLSEAVSDAAARPQVETLLAEVEALQELATGRLAAALDLPVGFNAFDGD